MIAPFSTFASRLFRWIPGVVVALSVARVHAGSSGGWLDSGATGEYFANQELSGKPAFVRRDVRVDFDWGTHSRPGGSPAPGFRDLGTDAYSVRWTGRLASRENGAHVLRVDADDGARLMWRGPDDAEFRTLVDAWATSGSHEAVVDLRAEAVYEVRLEYREATGPAHVRLAWRGPGFADEVVDTVSVTALNVATYAAELWANAMDGARDEWRDPSFGSDVRRWPARDERGWPRGDAAIIVWEDAEPSAVAGRYRLRFPGQARVAVEGTAATFFVDGRSVGNALPSGIGWDATSNVTTAEILVAPAPMLRLAFTETRRTPTDTTPTGVQNVVLLRPVAAGGDAAHPDGSRFDVRFVDALGRYQALRWVSNSETERSWGDRVHPDYSTHRDVETRRHWELMVQLANEAGKDLYACIPHRADDDYVLRVARLMRYGSDGSEPYDGPRIDPIHPPLNPNLRVYLERGNEVWDFWTYPQGRENDEDARREVATGTPNGAILNFDGTNSTGSDFYRWHALRSLQMSDLFRSVWGDANMGERVRFLFEGSFDTAGGWMKLALEFLDRYFNNGDGARHVSNPRPVKHFFWGSGSRDHYRGGVLFGSSPSTVVPNGDFESPTLPAGTSIERPAGTGWTFHGTAGLFAVRQPGNVTPGLPPNPPSGRQALWLAGTGAVTKTIDLPRPGTFALQFLAATPERETGVRFFIDDRNITPDRVSHRGPTDAHWLPGFGPSHNPRLFEYYGSYTFSVSNAGPRTIRIEATGLPREFDPLDARPEADRAIWFDRIEIFTLEELFAGVFSALGEANGQPAAPAAEREASRWSRVRYAQAYGLQTVAYQGGWSLGGDLGTSPIENVARFLDARAAETAVAALDTFARGGGALYTWGPFPTWPRYDAATSGSFPLAQGVDLHGSRLPPEPRAGIHVPNMLTETNAYWSVDVDLGRGDTTLRYPGSWAAWNVLVPVAGAYEFFLNLGGPSAARAVLQIDGDDAGPPVAVGISSYTATLSRGLHTLRVQSRAHEVSVRGVVVRRPGTPEAPRLSAIEEGDGTVTLRWAPGDGAPPEGYVLRVGARTGAYTRTFDLGSRTDWTLTDLPNHMPVFFELVARNVQGQGPPPPESMALPFPLGETASLATFELTGFAGTELFAEPVRSSARVTVSALRRGPGLLPVPYSRVRDTFGSVPVGNAYAPSLAESRQRRQYYELTVAPRPPLRLSLERLRFRPHFMDYRGRPGDGRGAGIAWSTNGSTFTERILAGTPSPYGSSEFTADLSSEPTLRDVPGPVVLRLHLFGGDPYEFTGLGGPGEDLVLEGRLGGTEISIPQPRISLKRGDAGWSIATPSVVGVRYRLWRSPNLREWESTASQPGTGNVLEFRVAPESTAGPVFWRIGADTNTGAPR